MNETSARPCGCDPGANWKCDWHQTVKWVEQLIVKEGGTVGLPTEDKDRKRIPIFTGFLMYFPDAVAAVAEVSRVGNEQHNPGEPLHWAREKSTDQLNTAQRHMIDHGVGNTKDTDGTYHLAKAIWRLAAELQLTIERERAQTNSPYPPTPGLFPSATQLIHPKGAEQPALRRTHPHEKGCPSRQPKREGACYMALECERPLGHSGKHMAWEAYDYVADRGLVLYDGGEW